MFDAFPYDAWSEEIAEFWTYGPANSTGTYIMTALGILLMVASLFGFIHQESRRLSDQAERLRKDGMLARMRPAAPTTPTSE
jgi:hypothetical protein